MRVVCGCVRVVRVRAYMVRARCVRVRVSHIAWCVLVHVRACTVCAVFHRFDGFIIVAFEYNCNTIYVNLTKGIPNANLMHIEYKNKML